MRSPFLGAFYQDRSLNLAAEQCVNLYLELAENKQGKQPGVLLMTPGLDPITTLGGSGPAPPPVTTAPLLYVSNTSCHIVAFPITASFTGSVAPQIEIEGSKTDLTEPITLHSIGSNTTAITVASDGTVYALSYYANDDPGTVVTSYAATATHNTAPLKNIGGASTGLPAKGASQANGLGGLCLDNNGNIWVGTKTDLRQFVAGGTGNIAPLQHIVTTDIINALFFDSTRNWIWATLDGGAVVSYDTSGALHRNITGASTALNSPRGIWVDSSGKIYVTNQPSIGPVGTAAVLVFASAANGNIAPIQNIRGGATGVQFPQAIAVGADGSIYVSDQTGTGVGNMLATTYGANILVFPSSATGNTAPTKIIQGANCAFDYMRTGEGSQPSCFSISPTTTIVTPYHPPSTLFTSAKVTTSTFNFPTSSHYGVLAVWSFGQLPTNSIVVANMSSHGFALDHTDGSLGFRLYNASGTQIFGVDELTIRNQVWYLDVLSWDTLTQTFQWYVSGVASANLFAPTWSSTAVVGYTAGDAWQIGHTLHDMAVAQMWFTIPNSFYNLASNIANFAANGDTMDNTYFCWPVDYGTNGLNPMGTQPLLFLNGAGPSFALNQGSGGGTFSITGALTNPNNAP